VSGAGDVPSGPVPPGLRRSWVRPEGWRGLPASWWAWLAQRAAALVLLVVVALHVANPFRRGVQMALLALVLLHGLLGLRALVLDAGVGFRWHRWLLAAALGLGLVLFVVVWAWRWA
jgi:succinate dehydrogenase hydrophobic anchor subunit